MNFNFQVVNNGVNKDPPIKSYFVLSKKALYYLNLNRSEKLTPERVESGRPNLVKVPMFHLIDVPISMRFISFLEHNHLNSLCTQSCFTASLKQCHYKFN